MPQRAQLKSKSESKPDPEFRAQSGIASTTVSGAQSCTPSRSNSRSKPHGKSSSRTRGKRRTPKQAEFAFRPWGGARKRAGRKRKADRPRVPHRVRSDHKSSCPVLVTTRLVTGVPSLRRSAEAECVLSALSRCSETFRIVHYSIQSNHLHLIVEARDRIALTSGVRGLLIRLARALNRLWSRSGSVFADRFHERELDNPWQVRNALVYVLNNSRKHDLRHQGPDPLSSGMQFDGWRTDEDERVDATQSRRRIGAATDHTARVHALPRGPWAVASARGAGSTRLGGNVLRAPGAGAQPSIARAARSELPRARTWLLDQGWKRHGWIDLFESPRGS